MGALCIADISVFQHPAVTPMICRQTQMEMLQMSACVANKIDQQSNIKLPPLRPNNNDLTSNKQSFHT